MNRATLVRGIQLIVVITLATFSYLLYDSIVTQKADLSAAFARVRPGFLLIGAFFALQEGVFGGLRMFALCRVLSKDLPLRTALISEFVLMFCAGVTPGQAGAAPSQVAVLAYGGMRLVDVATASLLAASCTITFFLASGALLFGLHAAGLLVLPAGAHITWLLGASVVTFGSGLAALVLCAAYPPLLKGMVRLLAVPFGALYRPVLRLLLRVSRLRVFAETSLATPGMLRDRLLASIDEFHRGFSVYIRRGKLAYAAATLLTWGFFCSRYAVAYFILLALGLDTTPETFVTIGPPIVQILLIQALLNFALYLSPTPGASGIAEAGSAALMSPWVKGPYELPYLVLWRIIALFLCMFVGGVYVFRYLGTDVLEKRVKETEAQKQRLRSV